MTSAKTISLHEVASLLTLLGFKTDQETLRNISGTCRTSFLNHLNIAAANNSQSASSRKCLDTALRCLSAPTLKKIERLAPGTSMQRVLAVATAFPLRFFSALDAAFDEQHDRSVEAREFLIAALTPERRPLSGKEAPPPPPAAPGSPHYRPPAPSGIADKSSRRPPTVPSAPSPPALHDPSTASVKAEAGASAPRSFETHHVYGSNAGLCFNAGKHRGKHGVMVDAAAILGPRNYDWNKALHLWLDINEVGAVIAVLRRWRDSVELSGHGQNNDKSFFIQYQQEHFFAKVSQRKAGAGIVRGVKIIPRDAAAICILLLKLLSAEYPTIPLEEILATVRATHRLSNAATA